MATGPTALRYMTRFRCIAERCEDTCCAGLRIPVSVEGYERMRAALASEPGLDRLAGHAEPNPDPAAPAEHAFLLRMRPDGHCSFFGADRLCSLQRRHGETVLSDACATFPRVISRRGERVEVVGTLACPEVARLCLLEADAVDPVSFPAEQVPRPGAVRGQPVQSEDAPALYADEVRAAALRLLARREYPLSSRLFFLSNLALRLDAFLFRGSGDFEGGLRAAGEVRLAGELQAFEGTAMLEAMHHNLSALEVPGGKFAGLFATVLNTRLGSVRSERFGALARGVLASLGATFSGNEPEEPDALWRAYSARRERLEAAHGERVVQFFHHYCVNHWMRSPHTASSSLLAYVLKLSLRVGLLRFTLIGHPAVGGLSGAAPAAEQEALDRAAVETFQVIAKHIEQGEDFISLAEDLAGAGGAEAFGRGVLLAKFC